VRGEALAVTMRTPGHDEELALGFLHGEGLIDTAAPVGPAPDLAANIVDVDSELLFDPGRRRFFNAMDKVVGRALLDGLLPLHQHLLCVSGRRRWPSSSPPTAP
jgi:formate dehydrogenase assembly factor FdhD